MPKRYEKEYIFVPKLYPMGAMTFSIACSVCKNLGSEFCENCKREIESHFEIKPTADVVEVVRCKDCVLRNTADCAMYYICECGAQYSWETGNDFCSFGKRKGK